MEVIADNTYLSCIAELEKSEFLLAFTFIEQTGFSLDGIIDAFCSLVVTYGFDKPTANWELARICLLLCFPLSVTFFSEDGRSLTILCNFWMQVIQIRLSCCFKKKKINYRLNIKNS